MSQSQDLAPGTEPPVRFGAWVAEVGRDWPEEALHSAHRQLIDVIACLVPGAVEPCTRAAFETVCDWGQGPCTVAGQSRTLAAPWAALVNGTAAHALDLDDNFDPPKAHPTTVLAPAILALAEQEGQKTGADYLDAYIVGLQILGRVGQGVNPYHRNRGWHATATLGAIGVAAACARLINLSAAEAATALSLATSMSAGFMSQFGTMAKPLHAGLAAKSGVMAACLARSGMSASMTTFDGRTGLNRLMVGPDYEELRDQRDLDAAPEHGQTLRFELESIGEPLLILAHGFRVKRFANCGASHRAMDALLYLRQTHGFGPDDVALVEIYAPKVHFKNLMYTDPQDGTQGRFSFEYAMAVCLWAGEVRLDDFEDAAVHRPELRAQMAKMRRRPQDVLETEFDTYVEVTLTDGRKLKEVRVWPEGSLAAPFTDQQYWEKYEMCTAQAISSQHATGLRSALEQLRDLSDLNALTRHLAGPFAKS